MSNKDKLQGFIFQEHAIRGAIVHMNDSYQEVLKRHPYPLAIRKVLGETLAVTALISSSLKHEGTLTLQVQTEGPLKLLVAQSNNQLQLRGLAQWEGSVETASFNHLLGNGKLAMTVSPKNRKQYQSIIPLSKGNLSASMSAYFQQSEQVPTSLYLLADDQQVGGILLQSLPNNSEEPEALKIFMDKIHTISPQDLFTLSNLEFLQHTFPEEPFELFDTQCVTFKCSCTIARMEKALLMYDRKEIQEILNHNKWVTVTCEFCNHSYNFEAEHVDQILSQTGTDNNESTKH